MGTSEASARLRALASNDEKRPETARLRDIFDDVEIALAAKVSQVNVLAELQALGYTMTLASFKSAIQRIRKERSKVAPALPDASSAMKTQSAVAQAVGLQKNALATSSTDAAASEISKFPSDQPHPQNENPIIASGVGTSLSNADKPKVELTFSKRKKPE